jgi:import inner membrane translocase subunit TIM17
MGAIGGSIWHFVKGMRNSPRGQRLLGSIDAVKLRAPTLGGSFAVWGGLFSTFDCAIGGLRGVEDPYNAIASGAITGGVLSARSGLRASARSALIGGVLLAIIEGLGIMLTRMTAEMGPTPEEVERMRREFAEQQHRQRLEGGAGTRTADGFAAPADERLGMGANDVVLTENSGVRVGGSADPSSHSGQNEPEHRGGGFLRSLFGS